MRICILILAWLCFTNLLFSQSYGIDACQCILPNDYQFYRTTIPLQFFDGHTDLPVLSMETRGATTSILLWSDGRIAWQNRKSHPHYYLSQIAKEKVELAFEAIQNKLASSDRLKGRVNFFRSAPWGQWMAVQALITSTNTFRREYWDACLFAVYIRNLEVLNSEDSQRLVDFLTNEKNSTSVLWGADSNILHQYKPKQKRDNAPLTNEEIVEYAKQFRDEVAFYLFFEKTLESLVPEEGELDKKLVIPKRGEYHVGWREMSSGKIEFIYLPCTSRDYACSGVLNESANVEIRAGIGTKNQKRRTRIIKDDFGNP